MRFTRGSVPAYVAAGGAGPALANYTFAAPTDGGTGLTTRSVTVPATTIGNFIAIGCGVFQGQVTSITDDGGNTYTQRATESTVWPICMWTAPVTGAATTITITEPAGFDSRTWGISVWEFSGVGGTIDNTGNGTDTTSPYDTPSLASGGSGFYATIGVDFLAAVLTFASGAGYTERSNNNSPLQGSTWVAADYIPTSNGSSYNASWTGSGAFIQSVAITVH